MLEKQEMQPDLHQTNKFNNSLVNKVEHLAAKETDMFLRSWGRPKESYKRVNIQFTIFRRWIQTQHQNIIIVVVCWMCK